MTTRRAALGIIGGALPAWTVAARAAEVPLSAPVPLDDPAVTVLENVWIPMPDGAKLAARIFLPASSGTEPAGAVLEYLPYRKRDGYRYRDDVVGPVLAKAGIALVRVDIRGTGESDGVILDEYLPGEQADALSTIEWIATQPWCNGNVGMRGISYGSFTGLQAAEKAPPALKAIVSTCGTEQRYLDDIHYRGGCLIQNQFDWAVEWQVVMRAPPDPEIVGEDWRAMWLERLEASGPLTIDWTEHQTLDEKWKTGSIQDYDAIRCAVFNVAGTLDSYLNSAPRMMERAPQAPQKALIGPWSHKWPGYPGDAAVEGIPGPCVDWLPVETRWWRHWLLGEANGIMDEPRIWAFRNDLPSGASFPRDTLGSWVSEPVWPSAGIEKQQWHLNADGLSREAGEQASLEHRTDLTIGFANRTSDSSGSPGDWWRDQAGDDSLCLTFDSDMLEAPLDVMGQPVFSIRVRSDRPVAKLCARLTEVTADGRSHFVSYALLNLTHRDGHEHPAPLKPGRDYDVRIEGQFACYRFSADSRIRIALSETWWPVVWPSPEPVTLQITAGASWVELPVRPARDGEQPPFGQFRDRFDVPGAEPAPYLDRLGGVDVTGSPGQRVFSLTDGSLEIAEEPIRAIGLTYGQSYRLRRTIREDDPNSAEMEAEATNSYARGEWKVRLRSWCLARSTPEAFLLSESFETWEGDQLVFSRQWDKAVPRQLV